jgi:hypothetical protein
MLGYLYQARYALLAGLLRSRTNPGSAITIERFDDVAFEDNGQPVELIQTKHHAAASDLSDSSPDLWRTLRIWVEIVSLDAQAPFETQFTMITTGTAPPNSACSLLRPHRTEHNVRVAVEMLRAAAMRSTNVSTSVARSAFMALEPAMQFGLCNAIAIYDMSPGITDVRSEIEDRLFAAAAPEHISAFVDYLEGWWFASVIKALTAGNTAIFLTSIRSKLDELRESFKQGTLPLDEPAVDTSADDFASDNRTFIGQLRSVALNERITSAAVRDYYRASSQRSRWARENLLLDGETQRYDAELIDRWSRHFEAQVAVSEGTNDSNKQAVGRNTFHWANQSCLPFRNRTEMWITAGSYQLLADDLRVGWHPDFRKLFSARDDK